MLDGLHEDLNLVLNKPPPVEYTPERESELESLPTQIAAEREWNIYLRRDDSIIVRLLQGQYKNQLRCQTCGAVSLHLTTLICLDFTLTCPVMLDIYDIQHLHVLVFASADR